MSKHLDQLISRRSLLREQLYNCEEQIRQERARMLKERYGVGLTDIVLYKEKEYSIVEVLEKKNMDGKPWLMGVKKLTNGGLGTKRFWLYGLWQVPKSG